MTQPRHILANTTALTVSRLCEMAGSFVLVLAASRLMGVAGLGTYSAAIALFGLFVIVGEMGAGSFLARELGRDPTRTSCYLNQVGLLALATSALITVAAVVALPFLGYAPDMATGIYAILLAVFPAILKSVQEAVFIAHQRAALITITTFGATCLNVSLGIVLMWRGCGALGLVVSFVVIQWAVALTYWLLMNAHIAQFTFTWPRESSRPLLQELRPFALSSLLGGLFSRPELILLPLLVHEQEPLGFYTAALKLVDVWYLLPSTLMINIFPVLSKLCQHNDGRSQALQDRAVLYLLAWSLPISMGLTAAARPIVTFVYGPEFVPSAGALQILAWNIPLYCLNAILWRALSARGEQRLVVRAQLVTTAMRLLSGAALIRWAHPLLGAASAVPVNLVLHNALLTHYLRGFKVRLPVLRLGWRFAVAALVMGGVTLVLSETVHLLVLVPSAAAVYAAIVFVLGGFSSDVFPRVRPLEKAQAAVAVPNHGDS